jgi:acetolactate decarboxylase
MIDRRMVHALEVERLRRADLGADLDGVHAIFQTSTLDAILDGRYDGDVTFAELGERGDFGLGTLDALDGEMIGVDGRFFSAAVDGSVREIGPDERTPFAVVTPFTPSVRFGAAGSLDHDELLARLDASLDDPALCYAVRVDGRFQRVLARSVPRQHPPYPPLAEAVKHEREFEFSDVDVTIVGFRFPDYAQGLNVPGYHLHFVTKDRRRGGHVLDCTVIDPEIQVDHTSHLHMELPPGVERVEHHASAADRAAIKRLEG